MDDRINRVITTALREWEEGIYEPPEGDGHLSIDLYIRDDLGLAWKWEDEYRRNGDFRWCGAFIAWIFGVGGPLRFSIRHKYLASCYRLRRWARRNGRLVDLDKVQRGDILILGDHHGPTWGRHMCLAMQVNPPGDWVDTIEGNARGRGHDGFIHEGVVVRCRPLRAVVPPDEYRVIWAVRFQAEDFDDE